MKQHHWLLTVMVALVLTGCAGLRQFPVAARDYAQALETLDVEYRKALAEIYKSPLPSADAQRSIRNHMIETRMAVIDAYFSEFQAGLVKESVRADLAIALVGVGVGAAGALAAETTSQILSAVSGGLAGGQAAYSKSVMYDKTLPALLAQMQAGRKTVQARIFESSQLDIGVYPLWLARTDLEAYYFAGSLPGAILGTAADAREKERRADAILLSPITAETVSQPVRDRRTALRGEIDRLSPTDAKTLLKKIRDAFPAVAPAINDQYPPDREATDPNGAAAKLVLRRVMTQTVNTASDADRWQAAIEGR